MIDRSPRRGLRALLIFAAAILLAAPATALAQPPDTGSSGGAPMPPQPHPPRLLNSVPLTATRTALFVDSPAMQRVVQVQVLHPDSTEPRPSLYLLDGVDAGDSESTWTEKTDVASFFAHRNVNVVLPVGGAGSYYTDWQRPDPALGVNRWETFLTSELPPLIDGQLHGNGANAVAGLSMGGHAALNLITRHPDLYRGVAAFSACPDSLDPNARSTVRATVASKGGDANNMWGPDDNPDWAAHDPMTNAAATARQDRLPRRRQRHPRPARAAAAVRPGGVGVRDLWRGTGMGRDDLYPRLPGAAGGGWTGWHLRLRALRHPLVAVLAGLPARRVAGPGPRAQLTTVIRSVAGGATGE